MRENIVVTIARQIKIRVVGHIDNCGSIGSGGIVHTKGIFIRQSIDTSSHHITRKTIVSVRRPDGKTEGMVVGLLGIIYPILPARRTSVEGMAIVVSEKLVGRTVDGETSVVKTVGITPDTGAKIGGDSLIVADIVETEYYIPHSAGAVGYKDRDNTSAEVGNTNLHTIGVGEGIEGSGLALAGGSEPFWTEP